MVSRIGLIAGNRKFPIIVASEAARANRLVVAIAIKGETSPRLSRFVEKIYWLGLDEFSKIFEIFQAENIKEAVMAGQISPRQLFRPQARNSPALKDLLDSLQDKRADTIFKAIAKRLEDKGITLLDSTSLMKNFLPKQGVLTKTQATASEREDIKLGLYIAKEIGRLDIGQTVAIKDKAIIAVEAFEGTDNLIRRAGKITRGNAVIVKMSKPHQDMRFDVPVVGLNTIKNLARIKAAGLVIEAGKTLFIDREQSIKLADRNKIWIEAV